jgi:PAS domain S-box-containing protein
MGQMYKTISQAGAQVIFGGVGIALLTFACYKFDVGAATTALLYLIIVVLLSTTGSLAAAAIVSISAFLCLIYFFTIPRFSLAVKDSQDVVALLVFFLVSVFVITFLSHKVKKSRHDIETLNAVEKELLRQRLEQNELFDLAPIAIVLTQLNPPQIIRVNKEFSKLFGYTSEEAVGHSLRDLIAPGDLTAGYTSLAAALRSGQKIEGEVVRQRKDGSRVPTHYTAAPVLNEEEAAWAFLVYRDLTDSKRAEQSLLRSEKFLAEGQKLSHTGSFSWRPSTGEINWSDETFRIYDYSPEMKATLDLARTRIHPGDIALFEETVRVAHDEGNDIEFEHRLLMPSDEIKHVRVVARSVNDDSGKSFEFIGAVMDVTAAHVAQESLARAFREMQTLKEQFQLAIDTIPELVWSSLPDGHIEYLNQRWRDYTGLTLKQANGWNWQIAIHSEDVASLVDYWKSVLISGKNGETEARLRRFDGEYRWFLFRATPLYDEAGNLLKWYGSSTDIEDRKRAEALIAGERLLLEMIAKGGSLSLTLNALCRSVEQMTVGSMCSVLLLDSSGKYLRNVAAPSLPKAVADAIDGSGVELGIGPCPMAAYLNERVAVPDIAKEARWPAFRNLTSAHGLRACTSTPILSSTGSVIGTIALYSNEPGFVKPQQQLVLEQFRSLASIAIERKRGEEARRVSAEGFALAMQASGEGHWDWHVETDEYYASPKMLELYGFAPDTVFAGRADFLSKFPFHPEDRAKWEADIAAHFVGNTARLNWEIRMIPNGETRWISLSGICTRNNAGKPIRWTGAVTDVTERKIAENALRGSEERFALVVAGLTDGIWDWDISADYFYASPRLLEMSGLPAHTVFTSRKDWLRRFPWHPEDRPKWECAIAAHFASRDAQFKIEIRMIPGGVMRWIQMTGICLRDGLGAPIRWTGSIADVTERKLAETALQKSDERFALAVAGSSDGIWDWDLVTNEMFLSARAQFLYAMEVGITVRPRTEWRAMVKFHPDDSEAQLRSVEEYIAGISPNYEGEWRVRHANGNYRWLRIRGLCVRDASGRAVRMAGSVSDIDSRKCAEAALRQALRLEALGTLAGGIAHDFNNILAAILGYGEMAARDVPHGSRLRRDLDSILSAGERGRALVERILAFSRSGVGERTAVHVEATVREALDLLTANLPVGIQVEVHFRAGRAAVLGDQTQIHQVIMNLATNAIQAMTSGGTLRVSLDNIYFDGSLAVTTGLVAAGDWLALSVADSGTGIAPENIEQIFDPFFTTKEVGRGTGLGLSLVHGIVTELGGAVQVSSVIGKGTELTVYLPRVGDAVDGPLRPISAMMKGNRQRILIVDDEEPLVRLMIESLKELGYRPTGFTSSRLALEAFRQEPESFDAVITDESMPGMSGSTLIREVRNIRGAIPILLISGYLGRTVVIEGRQAGANEVLKKPLSTSELSASLARVLSKE